MRGLHFFSSILGNYYDDNETILPKKFNFVTHIIKTLHVKPKNLPLFPAYYSHTKKKQKILNN